MLWAVDRRRWVSTTEVVRGRKSLGVGCRLYLLRSAGPQPCLPVVLLTQRVAYTSVRPVKRAMKRAILSSIGESAVTGGGVSRVAGVFGAGWVASGGGEVRAVGTGGVRRSGVSGVGVRVTSLEPRVASWARAVASWLSKTWIFANSWLRWSSSADL